MTIADLQKNLQELLDSGKSKPTDDVKFRNERQREKDGYTSYDVDLLYYGMEKNSLVLAYDDGMF